MKNPTIAANQPESSNVWKAYRPSEQTPWNLRRVVHLHRRAGFATKWNELQRDLAEGPEASVDRILNGSPREKSVIDNFESMANSIADAAVRSRQPDRLKAWWMYRMLFTSRPLIEKLTLLWHSHFATSNRKLDDLSLMRRQNNLFRTHALAPFGTLLAAVVQGVGYPNPNRSHFESAAIWHSAQLSPGDRGGFGWLGRALDVNSHRIRTFADAIAVGDLDPPPALRGRQSTQSTIRNLEDLQLELNTANVGSVTEERKSEDLLQFVRRRTVDAQATAERIAKLSNKRESSIAYPGSDLANRLKTIARLIRAELEPRVYYTVQSGYDTHVMQFNDHYQLLAQFSGALKTFLDDLQETQLADRVLVLVFSEFGRRVEENDSQGTDHGTAGPMFLAGLAVNAGLHGQNPDLSNLEEGDLTMTIDFRSIYATVLSEWLQVDPAQCLHGQFETTNLLES